MTAQSLTLCELLEAFPSCRPRAGTLLSLLPPLPPRYYSVASSQIATPGSVSVAFSVVTYRLGGTATAATAEAVTAAAAAAAAAATATPQRKADAGSNDHSGSASCEDGGGGGGGGGVIARKGLCTNWLEEILAPLLQLGEGGNGGKAEGTEIDVPLFLKPTKEFLLPASAKWPCVLIGPGTG